MNNLKLEFGPDTNGWMRIHLHSGVVGTLVWVGDNTTHGYGSFQNGLVYWHWIDSPPFPAGDFTLRRVNGAPPAFSSDMMAFPNAGFALSQTLTEPRTLSVTPPQTVYRVTPSPNVAPPASYGLLATPGSGYQLQWSASDEKPPDQTTFWPYSSSDATLAFRYLNQNSHTFEKGTTFYPVSETQD